MKSILLNLFNRIDLFRYEILPLILTGDFNLTKETSPIQLILTEFQDSRDHSKQAPYGPDGTSGGFEVKLMPRTIDYIFIKGRVAVQRQGVLTQLAASPIKYQKK